MDQNNDDIGVDLQGKLDIEKALKEFEVKSTSYKAMKFYNEPNTPKIVKLVIKYSGGAISDEKQANYVLFGFVVVAIVVSLFLFFGVGNTQQKPTTTSINQMKQFMNTVPSSSN